MVVQPQFLLTLLSLHRPELIQADYPPLSPEEARTTELLKGFLSLYSGEVAEHEKALRADLRAEQTAIAALFPSDEDESEVAEAVSRLDFEFYWKQHRDE